MKKLSKKEWIGVAIGIVVVGAMFGFGPGYFFFNEYKTMTLGESTDNSIGENQSVPTADMPSDLVAIDTVVGTGATAEVGSTVSVHYVGTFADGTKFDSSIDRGTPFEFTIGQSAVIEGWHKGLVGMKVGGTRRLVIPPDLGYGMADYGPIPGGSTLYFEIQLLDIK